MYYKICLQSDGHEFASTNSLKEAKQKADKFKARLNLEFFVTETKIVYSTLTLAELVGEE